MVNRGFTIIEAIIAMAVFLLVAGALFGMSQLILAGIGQTRVRHTARLLATEKLEEARNLPYNSLGTTGGIPSGPLPQQQEVNLGGLAFTITTSVIYIDDPFDGLAPADTLSSDYKRVRIAVTWGGSFPARKRPVVLISDVAPKGVETAAGGGTLSILVFNAKGEPLSGAQVNIVNTQVNPNINLSVGTDTFGRVLLPGSPVSTEGYQITVTKNGYSTDRTYSSTEVANPTKPHLSVLEGEVTEVSFAIDKVSTLTLYTYNNRVSGWTALPNISLRLRGSKIIGTDTQGKTVYKYNQLVQTDSSAKIEIANLEFDSYSIEVADPAYDLAGSNPALPLALAPDSQIDTKISLAADSAHSLLVLVENVTQQPLASASAHLVNSQIDYDTTVLTGDPAQPDFGYAFFDNLTNAEYQLSINLAGYQEVSTSIQVANDTAAILILDPL